MRLLITVEGKSYEVNVKVLADTSVEPWEGESGMMIPDSVLLPPLQPDLREADKICRTPIAGAVVSVEVKIGDYVQQNDPVVTIDAMKMQTVVGAPVDGMVGEVHVKPGDALQAGQVLCRLE